MEFPFGVSHFATVTLSEVSGVICTSSCTEPLPNDFSPTNLTPRLSRNAPARISEAEADAAPVVQLAVKAKASVRDITEVADIKIARRLRALNGAGAR